MYEILKACCLFIQQYTYVHKCCVLFLCTGIRPDYYFDYNGYENCISMNVHVYELDTYNTILTINLLFTSITTLMHNLCFNHNNTDERHHVSCPSTSFMTDKEIMLLYSEFILHIIVC